jgi:hypothetical protein
MKGRFCILWPLTFALLDNEFEKIVSLSDRVHFAYFWLHQGLTPTIEKPLANSDPTNTWEKSEKAWVKHKMVDPEVKVILTLYVRDTLNNFASNFTWLRILVRNLYYVNFWSLSAASYHRLSLVSLIWN